MAISLNVTLYDIIITTILNDYNPSHGSMFFPHLFCLFMSIRFTGVAVGRFVVVLGSSWSHSALLTSVCVRGAWQVNVS